jgi:hypothetical protein
MEIEITDDSKGINELDSQCGLVNDLLILIIDNQLNSDMYYQIMFTFSVPFLPT